MNYLGQDLKSKMGIAIKNLSKNFLYQGQSFSIFTNLNLQLKRGSFTSIFGPNGCGKTTLLNAIANLVDFEGEIIINSHQAKESRVGYICQKHADSLMPWLTNIKNIELGMDEEEVTETKKQRVFNFFNRFDLDTSLLTKYPWQCSGGEQQIIVLVRELIRRPDILLLDEPFSSLDFGKRLLMQKLIIKLWQETHITVLFVSHDIEEAIYLADSLLLFSRPPTKTLQKVEISLARPRSIEILGTEAFKKIKMFVLEDFVANANEKY